MGGGVITYDIVIPTSGRGSLDDLLQSLGALRGELPQQVVVVDDRRRPQPPLKMDSLPAALRRRTTLARSGGRGPAAARNLGWRTASAPWVAFLDDDVICDRDWAIRLARDLAEASPEVAAVQGRVRVPLPTGRRPTDWERNVAGLERARWITADLAVRRTALEDVGGFDTRFGRAFREDADLALRLMASGWRLQQGRRWISHPARPASFWVSVRLQRGNADDALMAALHGRDWHARAGATRGRFRRHLITVGAAGFAVAGAASRRRASAVAGATAWAALTADLAWSRIAAGPRTPAEVARMSVTSLALPFAAAWWRLVGELRSRQLSAVMAPQGPAAGPGKRLPAAVLFDRDGTLVVDVPYNGDPDQVRPMPGAREALDRLRRAGVPVGIVSNQSGVGRGLVKREDVVAVNRRIEDVLGPMQVWAVCLHGPEDGCRCRKPESGLILQAAERLGVQPGDCAVVGDIGSDVAAARSAGARSVLVPTPATREEDIASASEIADDLIAAVDRLLRAEP